MKAPDTSAMRAGGLRKCRETTRATTHPQEPNATRSAFGSLWPSLSYSPNVEKQLAAIEATRAVPDSENAAIIYTRIFEDHGEALLSPPFLDPNTADLTCLELWSARDHPKLARWMDRLQEPFAALLQAARKDKCRFPIYHPTQSIRDHLDKRVYRRTLLMRKWVRFLIRAANNDAAEGRIDQALHKYFCVARMGRHIQQQPVAVEFLNGLAMEKAALRRMRTLLVEGSLARDHFDIIEAELPPTEDKWSEISPPMLRVETLYAATLPSEDTGGLINRLKAWLTRSDEQALVIDHIHRRYIQLIADRRGNRILIELSRYKSKTGRWPPTLDEITNKPS